VTVEVSQEPENKSKVVGIAVGVTLGIIFLITILILTAIICCCIKIFAKKPLKVVETELKQESSRILLINSSSMADIEMATPIIVSVTPSESVKSIVSSEPS
jgi:hypothetical protein